MAKGLDPIKVKDFAGHVGKMSNVPAKVGDSLMELLMAAPNHHETERIDDSLSDAVRLALDELDERSRFAIEAVYIWGHSYSEIAKMMGYSSKASAHDIVASAEKKLEKLLRQQPRIMKLLEANGELEH